MKKTSYLFCVDVDEHDKSVKTHYDYLVKNFLGKVMMSEDINQEIESAATVYFCGDYQILKDRLKYQRVKISGDIFIIRQLSYNHSMHDAFTTIDIGEVPLNIKGIGVLFPNAFSDKTNVFESSSNEHHFQKLTESNKPSFSFRKGIYLTDVIREDQDDSWSFKLLRCSTNLDGPTENLTLLDHEIVDKVNSLANTCYENSASLNHVLAQVYENYEPQVELAIKEKKARIKSHSDKTADMPNNSLIAFCTFYSENYKASATTNADEPYDRFYKHGSILTRLRFKLKESVFTEAYAENMIKDISVTLYPNSVFIISLETNRFYTHEIVPPNLPVDKIPTRLGYVIRSSKTLAVYKNDKTYIMDEDQNKPVELRKPNDNDRVFIKSKYSLENTSHEHIVHEFIDFSLNQGDFLKPSL